jgi:PAS domain S-box-containing protein
MATPPSEELSSQELYRAVFENATVGIRVADLEGRIVRANPAMHALLGYADGELIGRGIFDLLHPDDRPQNRERTADVVARRAPSFQLENRYLRADGTVTWARLSVSPLLDDEGAVTLTIGIVEDVTVRREIQDELQTQAAQLARTWGRTAAILDSAVDSIVTIDARGRIESVNPATERLFGYAASELVGHNVSILMPPPYRDEHDGYLARYLRTGERRIIGIGREVVARRKDGSLFPVDLAVSEVPLAGERLFVGTIRDVTARKQLEGQLRQAMKIEAIGSLAGGVAHDFNNLLASILGYSEQLAAALPEGSLRHAALQVQRSAQRGAGLTRQLLAFSRRQEVVAERIDVGAVLEELHDMLARLIGEQVELRCDVAEGGSTVLADRGQLEQVVMNLVVNARDAISGHGTIALRVDNVTLAAPIERAEGTVPAGAWVRLVVRDDGSGMTTEVKSRIFEPFFTTKEVGKGTGLGLSTVYGIVQQSRGAIVVDSEPGEGATFEIYLPRVDGRREAAAAAADAEAPARGGHETVLLVEDDDTFRELIAEVLRRAGYAVLVAADPDAALRLAAEQGAIDLLVSDLAMPRLKGSDLARQLLVGRPGLRVLLMSGYSERDEAVGVAAELGGAFLAKPFRLGELLAAARRLLDEPTPPPA